jgi:hypothetical protein
MPLTVQVKIDEGVARMGRLPDDIRAELKAEVRAIGTVIRDTARSKASGDVLKVRTGEYRKSIKLSVRSTTTKVQGRVYTRNPLANIFEYGDAHLPARVIYAKNVKALHFMMSGGGGETYAAHVNFPGATIAQRTVIFSAFGEEKSDIKPRLTTAMRRGSKVNATGRSIPSSAPVTARE